MPDPTATPGPWTAQGQDIMAGKPPFERGRPGWRVVGVAAGRDEEAACNARLMAAAPDLLAAVRKGFTALRAIHFPNGDPADVAEALQAFRSSIQAATGRDE